MMAVNLGGVVFDFDGTLVRSHTQVYAVLSELAREYKLNLPAPEKLRQLSTRDQISALGLRFWQIPRFTALAQRKLTRSFAEVEFEEGVLDLIRNLKKNSTCRVGIVSSNSKQNIDLILRKYRAEELFDEILCGSSMLGKHRNIAKMTRRLKLQPAQVLYVGDETRDIEAGRRAQVKTAAVAWGFHVEERLLEMRPDFFAKDVEELKAILRIE